MEENRQRDQLEGFFHKNLDQYQAEPSIEFWDRLEQQIPEKPKRKFFWWPWFCLALTMIASLVVYLIYFDNLSENSMTDNAHLEQKQERFESQLNEIQTELSTQAKKVEALEIESSNETKSKASVQKSNKNFKSKTPSNYISKTITNNTRSSNIINDEIIKTRNLSYDFKSRDDIAEETINGTSSEKVNIKDGLSPIEAINSDQLEEIPLLSNLLNEVVFEPEIEKEFEWIPHCLPPEPIEKQRKKNYIGIYGERKKLNKYLLENPNLTLSQMSKKESNSLGFVVGKKIGRHWNIELGFGYTSVLFESVSGGNFSFTTFDSNLDENDNPYKNYNLDVETNYGLLNITSSIGYELQDLNLPQESFFSVNFTLEQKLKYLSIPLTIDYTIGQKRLQGIVRSGIRYHLLLSNKLNIKDPTFKLWEPDLEDFNRFFYRETVGIDSEETQKGFLEATLGLGASYRINKNITAVILPAINQGLTPLGGRTRPTSWQLKVELWHLF